jgi:hypothetical protein
MIMVYKELYETAVGKKYCKYYLAAFENIENGVYWKSCWNWWAFIFGPFWMFNRRFSKLKVLSRIVFTTITILYVADNIKYPINVTLISIIYCLVFPVAANILYRYEILKFIERNTSQDEASKKIFIRQRFITEIELAQKNNGLV